MNEIIEILNIKLIGNEYNLIENILSYIRCKSCNLLEIECKCLNCIHCKILTDQGFFCDCKCGGDFICHDCNNYYICDECEIYICENCVGINCCKILCICCFSNSNYNLICNKDYE